MGKEGKKIKWSKPALKRIDEVHPIASGTCWPFGSIGDPPGGCSSGNTASGGCLSGTSTTDMCSGSGISAGGTCWSVGGNLS